MRVAFVCAGWAPDAGGVETHARELALGLVARGHSVSVLCLDVRSARDPYTLSRSTVEGVRVTRMAFRWQEHRTLIDLVRNPSAERAVAGRKNEIVEIDAFAHVHMTEAGAIPELDRATVGGPEGSWIGTEQPDIVHVHHATGFGLSILSAIRERGVPLVVSLHDLWALCPRGQMWHVDGHACERAEESTCGPCIARTWPHLVAEQDPVRAAAERTEFALDALRHAGMLLVPSRAVLESYVRAGVERASMRMVRYGFDVAGLRREVDELRAHRVRDGRIHVGYMGAVQPSKGVLELARAFVEAAEPDAVLDVHGPLDDYHGDRACVDALCELAARDGRVRLHGAYARTELPRVLASLDAVAVPSRWPESYGLVAREAAAAGLPMLVSDAGALPELLEEGVQAQVVSSRDTRGWPAAVRELIERARKGARADPPCTASSQRMTIEIEDVYARADAGNTRLAAHR